MFYLETCGFAQEHPDGLVIHRAEGTPFYTFVYFRTPSEVLEQGEWIDAQNKYVLFPPNTPYFFRSKTQPYINDWIYFKTDDYGRFFNKLRLPINAVQNRPDAHSIERSVHTLQEILYYNEMWKQELADNELQSLFYRLSAGTNHTQPTPATRQYYDTLANIRSELYSLPTPDSSVDLLASQARLSASYFQSIYKKQFGVSVGEDIIRSRLERARYLLQNSNYSVSETATMSGYVCEAHFIRQFKKFIGLTPGRYRQTREEQQ